MSGPYSGEWQYSGGLFRGFGWGPTQETLCGLPHFSGHCFRGEFPVAEIHLSDPDFPGEKLLAGLRAVEARYGIHLTLHDCRGLLCHADGRPFFPDRCMHMHPYCITGRFEMPGWNRRCHEECKLRVEANADRLRRPFLHHCWKGVTELIVPFVWDGVLELIFYVGPFRGPEVPAKEEFRTGWSGTPGTPRFCGTA